MTPKERVRKVFPSAYCFRRVFSDYEVAWEVWIDEPEVCYLKFLADGCSPQDVWKNAWIKAQKEMI